MILQRLNRLQNRNEVMLGDAKTGQVRTVLVEQDSTWVDVVDDLVWLDGGKSFTWVSERDGWNHVYVVSRDGKQDPPGHQGRLRRAGDPGHRPEGRVALLHRLAGQPGRSATSSAPGSTAREAPERLSPAREPGTHVYDVAPNYRYAIETYSSFGNPPIIRLVRLPEPRADPDAGGQPGSFARGSTALRRGPVEWLNIAAEDGAQDARRAA